MGIIKTSECIQIKIKMSNPIQESPASSKAPNGDLKAMDVLCTLEIKIESQNLELAVSKTSDHIKFKIKMPNPIQEPPASLKSPNNNFWDMDVLCTFKIKIERQNLEHGFIKDQGPYLNQDKDAKAHPGTSSIFLSTKSELK